MSDLLCIGNILLELHLEVTPEFVERYGLRVGGMVQVEERHRNLLKDILTSGGEDDKPVSFAAGGNAAVAARVVAALSRAIVPGIQVTEKSSEVQEVVLLGSVGEDTLGERLQELLVAEGVRPLFSEADGVVTGWRAMLRCPGQPKPTNGLGLPPGEEESDSLPRAFQVCGATCAGASREYKLDHLRFKVWESVETAQVVYVDAAFLAVSTDSVRIVAAHCTKMKRVLCLNLSAEYICSFFFERILQVLPYTDYVIGHAAEFLKLSEHLTDLTSEGIDAVITWVAKVPRADGNPRGRRYVIATDGREPVTVGSPWRGFGVKIMRYPVPPVRSSRFVSKDGAGAAFAGGLLYGLQKALSIDSCMELALFAAHAFVQTPPPNIAYRERPCVEKPDGAP